MLEVNGLRHPQRAKNAADCCACHALASRSKNYREDGAMTVEISSECDCVRQHVLFATFAPRREPAQ